MIYRELNPDILSSLSVLSFSDVIYVFPNFFLGLFSTLDVLHNFKVRFFYFPWRYFEPVGIPLNAMYYFYKSIDRLTHYYHIVINICDEEANK